MKRDKIVKTLALSLGLVNIISFTPQNTTLFKVINNAGLMKEAKADVILTATDELGYGTISEFAGSPTADSSMLENPILLPSKIEAFNRENNITVKVQ